jgi:hypothetical protein
MPNGIPVEFATDIYSVWLKFIKDHPVAEKSMLIIQLYHPQKWSTVPSDATAFVNRNPVRGECGLCRTYANIIEFVLILDL